MTKIAIPYGGYWSSPLRQVAGKLAHLHSLRFAATVAKASLAARNISPEIFDFGVLGMTVPQKNSFYGLPWLMGEIGAAQVAGPTINQACATGARILETAHAEISAGACTSRACHRGRPNIKRTAYLVSRASGTGGTGEHEDWVLDNFSHDPFARLAMVETAENVAKRYGIDTREQNEVTLRRYQQYGDALANDSAFLKRFMTLPFAVPDARFSKQIGEMSGDDGVHPTTAEKLAALKPVIAGGTMTYGTQTHPADGTAADPDHA